ncbi:hypothetical protein BGX38DRAFT_1139895 [Terfezia claveryi]|nr:hypothetical protein BGX38DRAFT_1139895 [Terfezia claveryi]
MASAMKKLKTLHNINTNPSHRDHSPLAVNSSPAHYIHHKIPTTPPSSNSSPADKPKRYHRSRIPVPVYNQPLTPPISPTNSSVSNSAPPSPQQNQRQRNAASAQSYRQENRKYYADMLRSARQALHQFQHHHHASQAQQQQQQQRSVYPVLSEFVAQSQQQKRHPALPGGAFLVLTQDDSHPAMAASPQHQRVNIPTLPITGSQQFSASATSNSRTAAPQTPARSSRRKPPPLTKNAVELILQDTRMARWQRVQGYVREQRQLVASEQNEESRRRGSNATENPIEGEGYPWGKYMYGWTDEANKNTVNIEQIYAAIDRKNFLLSQLDTLPEIQERSMWSGGSAGTNGVDEFVWDDDEEGFQGDADMLDVDDWGNREREKMKRAYQRQQLKMQQEAQMLKMRQQQQQAGAVEERFMKEEEARAAVADHRRRYQRPVAADTPPRTPTSSGGSSRQQQTAQATPPQLKAYTASFFKSKGHLTQQQRSPRQEHSRPGTAGSGSVSPGYKRQSIGRGIVGGVGKTGSFGSVDGAVFRMDGESMDVDNSNNLPLPSSYLTRATQYQQQHSRGSSTPSYCSPTFASLGKSRTGAVAGGASRSPTGQSMAVPAMDKGLREYMEALRRYEVRCATDAEQADLVNDSGSSGKRRRRPANAVGTYY